MYKNFLFIIVLLMSKNLFSQTVNDRTFLPQGYSLNLLNGFGNSALVNNVSNLSVLNPSALNNFNGFTVGLSSMFAAKIEPGWFADIGAERINNALPQSAGLVFPVDNFHFGISFSQKYNAALIFPLVEITTPQNPGGTGEKFQPEYESRIINYSLIASYNFKNILKNSSLSVGFRFSLEDFRFKESIYLVSIDKNTMNSSWSVGINYTNFEGNNRNFQVGLSYDNGNEFNKIAGYDLKGEPNNRPDFDDRGVIRMISSSFSFTGKLPKIFRLDADISTIEKTKLLGSVSYLLWDELREDYDNSIDFSASVVRNFSDNLNLSLGMLYTARNYIDKEDYVLHEFEDELGALFFTLGGSIKLDFLNIDVSLADSHLLSGEWRKQTIGKVGVSYNFTN